MMNTNNCKIYDENDIEILDNGISVEDTFFSKQEIANTFNELFLVRNFIKKESNKSS